MIYEFDWKNPSEWQHDGTLSYDKENEVLFFDTKEAKAECSKTIEIPEEADCFEFSFVAGNSSPVTRDSDSGKVRLSFLDENDAEITGFDTLISEKEYFYKYTASSTSMPFPIPKAAEKMVIEASGTNRGKDDLNFYFKNFTLEFKNEESTEIITDYTGVFTSEKVGDKLIKIGNDSKLTTIGLWVLLGVIAVTGVFRIVKYDKSKNKEQ
ncbi:MAG: hypothetical protein E7490_08325 [Ruminococcaceae bacterium]|nr:hypothetical protein [Oscillospiraceae bacterium]